MLVWYLLLAGKGGDEGERLGGGKVEVISYGFTGLKLTTL